MIEKENEWLKNKDPQIFASAMNSLVHLDQMTKKYSLQGINPYLKGKSS